MSGTSGSKLDQAVKGAAPIGTSTAAVLKSRPSTPASPSATNQSTSHPLSSQSLKDDPLATLPSAPPQIYLNMLILEASLRSQYLTLRDRRRQNTFFISLLALWITYFSYALFLAPREDGQGIGGSVYWVVETGEKVALMAGVVTGILIWGTGQWERGVRWPRRFVGITNRGLRSMNCKMVVLKGPWWREMLSHLAFLFPWWEIFGRRKRSEADFRFVEQSSLGGMGEKAKLDSGQIRGNSVHLGEGLDYLKDEDLSHGGNYIKLLLLPKPFSPDFRENWEVYRTEYWMKENARRARVRQKLKQLEKAQAKEEGDWFWWTGWHGWRRRKTSDLEKTHTKTISERDFKRLGVVRHGESHSRNASRTSLTAGEERPTSRGSKSGSATSQDGRRRSSRNSMSGIGTGMMAGAAKRSSLATMPPLTRGDSFAQSSASEKENVS